MAASNTENKIPITDRTAFWQSLSYMPTDLKESRLWCSQMLFYSKKNSVRFQEPVKAQKYRRANRLDIDTQDYKNLIDPPTAKDKGGDARYFSADFKDMPIDVHLDNIAIASLKTLPLNLTVKLVDPIAKSQEMKDKEKILAQGMVRNIINWFMDDMGKPRISESTDPYKWIQNFTATDDKSKVDEIGDTIDQIRTRIHDDFNLRLFQNYLYKNGLEIAFEIGIKYYFLTQNEWQAKHSDISILDLKHFNKYSGLWSIDEMTGRATIRYVDPVSLYTSPFKYRNGDDIIYYFFEENVTFAEFERLVGSQMTYEEKKKALTLQKEQGWTVGGLDYFNNSRNNNSHVRLGFFGVLTQEANAFSEKFVNDTTTVYDNKPLTWQPENNEEEKVVKAYNVWYSCYYMPITASAYESNSPTDWEEQSHYIFKIEKDIDMMRYGAGGVYAKPPLIIYKDDKQASWTDIKEAFMPKIRTLWHKFQNAIVQDVQAVVFDEDLLGGMLNAVDEANMKGEKGGDAIVNEWKQLKQAGFAFLKFRDKNGNLVVNPNQLMINVDNGMLKKAEGYMQQILEIYNLMTQALATGGANEAVQPDARTPLGGIQIANEAANKARYFLQQSYIVGVIVPYAQRCAHFIHNICKEKNEYGYEKRWKQFNDVVGRYNGAVIESIEDIDLENIGFEIINKEESSKKEIVLQQVITKYAQNQISTAALGLIMDSENWKLQLVELSLEEAKKQEERQAEAAQQQQYVMEQKKMDLQIAQALQGAKAQGVNSNIQTQSQMDALLQKQESDLKAKNQEDQKKQLLQSKLIEHQQQAELKKDVSTHNANLDEQKSVLAA